MSKVYKSIQLNDKDKVVISHNYQNPSDLIDDQHMKSNDGETDKEQLEVHNARRIADNLVSEAQKLAEDLLEREKIKIEDWWNKKREDDAVVIEQAQEKGYQDGYEAGVKQAEEDLKQQYHQFFEQAQAILNEAFINKEQIIQESENAIFDLSITIAEKIILKEIELNLDIIKEMIKETLRNTKEYEKISIYINPNHFTYIQSAREELLSEINGQVELMVFPDPLIETGGCMVKTSYGTLDAKIDTQLEEIKNILLDISGRRQE